MVSSPLFYESSPAAEANMDPSSPLRQMSNTQSTQDSLPDPDVPMQGIAPSSPLAQMETQSSTGDRTPRASRNLFGGKSLLAWHYQHGTANNGSSRILARALLCQF